MSCEPPETNPSQYRRGLVERLRAGFPSGTWFVQSTHPRHQRPPRPGALGHPLITIRLHPRGMAELCRGWTSPVPPKARPRTPTHGRCRMYGAPRKGARTDHRPSDRQHPYFRQGDGHARVLQTGTRGLPRSIEMPLVAPPKPVVRRPCGAQPMIPEPASQRPKSFPLAAQCLPPQI
jgi:hypothetical protein